MSPRVSVLLPVYNVAPYIRETIASILAQTFTDFELIVVDDVSKDDTAAIVASIDDPRLRLVRNPHNLGRAGTDNAGLAYVRGEYLAKMDGDDLCVPERLALQVAYLDAHPEVNVVGGWVQNIGASNYLNRYPAAPADAQVLSLFTLPTANPTVLMRTSLFREQGMTYDASLRQTEDYDFFVRYLRELKVASLQQTLLYYRVPEVVRKKDILSERATVSDEVRARLLDSWQLPYSPRELHVYNTIAMLDRPLGDITLPEVAQWLQKLLDHNQRQPLFAQDALARGLGERWFEVCYTHPGAGLTGLRTYARSPLAAHWRPSFSQRARFWVKSLRQLAR